MKKQLILATIILISFAALLQTASALSPSSEYYYLIELQKTTFLPSTIYSGDIVSVAFDIKNRGSSLPIKDLNASLDLGDQFEPIEISNSISLIKPQATKTLVLKFQVREDTTPGYYPMQLKLSYLRDNELIEETQTIQVPVTKAERNLEVSVKPSVIGPGNQTSIAFVLKNTGRTPISNISFSWSESGNLILPLGSNNKKYVSIIDGNSETEVSYLVGTDPNMTTGIYPLDVSISFSDSNGQRTQTSQVGIIIGGSTDFEVSAEKQSTGQISISIANIGSNNASAVVVKVPEQQGIVINGSNSAILGSINKGDFTIANFQIQQSPFDANQGFEQQNASNMPQMQQGQRSPDRNFQMQKSSMQSMTVQIDYTDTTGERQSVLKKVALSNVTSTTSTAISGRTQNSQQPLIYWGLLIGAIILSALFDKIKAKISWKKMAAIWLATATAFFAVSIMLNSNIIAGAVIAVVSVLLVIWLTARAKKKENQAKISSGEKKK